jgi:5-methyltetrahydrofolate--homocysteine methyltransferase
MAGRGTGGWLPYFCEGRYATVQCDFSCLLSPAQFAEFALPALAEECEFLDRSVYHYDGATCLQHFDAVTSLAALDGIQWTPTAGGPPMIEWMDLLKRFQAAGKNVFVGCSSADELKVFHRELEPHLVLYRVHVGSEREAEELLAWLVRNT